MGKQRKDRDMKPVVGFENYGVTKDGRVWSHYTDRWVAQSPNNCGYLIVCLCKNKNKYWRKVHRLVLETFSGLCPDGMECRHLNGNRNDNRLENLKWGTHSQNMQDAKLQGKLGGNFGEKNGSAKLTEQDVRMIVYMYNTGLFTKQEIADLYNVHQPQVSRITNKQTWKHIWNTRKGE